MEETYESIFPERKVVYAGFGDRFGAALIDTVIVVAMQVPVRLLLQESFMQTNWYSIIVNLVVGILYYTLQESGPRQATIGKRMVGIYVMDVDGGKLSFGQALGRYFGKMLSGLILCIGYLIMIWDSRKQTLHDKMAGTLVVYKN